jgi:metal-responsive CopG/Arc/MetJ family transcriptional regulator
MTKAKISISMKEASLQFISQYQSEYAVSNRSGVIEKVLELLMEEVLGLEYREANKAI